MISIIVPLYNAEEFLHRCIDSILQQSYKDFEVILINDGSTDDSALICEKYVKKDCRVRVIHQINRGVSSARNAGLEKAAGDFICFVDADDWLHPDMLKILFNKTIENDADITICDVFRVKVMSEFTSIPDRFDVTVMLQPAIIYMMLERNNIGGFCHSRMYKSYLFKHLRFDEKMTMLEDVLINWEIFKKSRIIIYLDLPLYYYFTNNNSITNTMNSQKLLNGVDILNYINRDVQRFHPQYYDLSKQNIIIFQLMYYGAAQNNQFNILEYKNFRNTLKYNINWIIKDKKLRKSDKAKAVLILLLPYSLSRLLKKFINKMR